MLGCCVVFFLQYYYFYYYFTIIDASTFYKAVKKFASMKDLSSDRVHGGEFPNAYLNNNGGFSVHRDRVKEKLNIDCVCDRCVLAMMKCLQCNTCETCTEHVPIQQQDIVLQPPGNISSASINHVT